ncbi:MAG: threonylcarbamoyl-AMP synthase [Alphaproteobacteria bacterium]|jgi:L-threonylcarbamoyladenylate synthase|nr:threonylcarbamoyl-AMP synthase [Alphaproteobacteria bacterium]
MAKVLSNTLENIIHLAEVLNNGEVVAFPTDTVYGLGSIATNETSLLKLYDYKKRPKNNPLVLYLHDILQTEEYLIVNDIFYRIAEKFLPGAITLILNKKSNSKIHPLCSNYTNKLGLRIPNNETCLKLLSHVKNPIVATSGNLSSQISPTTANHVLENFKNTDLLILNDNNVLEGIESTILDISEEDNITLLRYGAITLEQLQELNLKINVKIADNSLNSYTFKTKICLNSLEIKENEGLLAFGKIDIHLPNSVIVLNLSESGNLKEASQNLFAMLIKLENMNLKKIHIMSIPNVGLGVSINQRLLKLPKEE